MSATYDCVHSTTDGQELVKVLDFGGIQSVFAVASAPRNCLQL